MPPLVSILTPCFNHEKYLDDYFQSILDQDYPNIELVFRDDCSTDKSWSVFLQWESRLRSKLTRVIAEEGRENLGLLLSMDWLSQRASGDFISLLESDDFFYPEKTSRQIAYFESHPDVGALHSDVDFLAPDGTLEKSHWKQRRPEMPEGNIFEALLSENHILSCTFCCRAELWRKHSRFLDYQRNGYRTADYPVFLDLAMHTQFGYLDQSLACYRVLENSLSHPPSLLARIQWKEDYYRIKLEATRAAGVAKAVRQRARKQWWKTQFLKGYVGRDFDLARRALEELKQIDPQWKSWKMEARKWSVRLPEWLQRLITSKDSMV